MSITDQKVIDATYRDYVRILARDLTPSMDGAANVIAQLKSINLPVGSENPRDYLDLSIIDKLKAEGFIAQMQKQYNVNREIRPCEAAASKGPASCRA